MADERVLEAQRWVNATYGAVPGYVRCAEDGKTGWSTMYSLTRGLQRELGITALSDSFGPATLAALEARGRIGPADVGSNLVRIAQHGLYCKGYSAGPVTGTYHLTTQTAVQELMRDAGVTSDGFLYAKWFKAILTMDAYVLTPGGNTAVRDVQRWLNAQYIARSTFFVGPCDGHYSRDVQVALMKGLQYESGIPDAQVNGNFGPATQNALRAHRVGPGWSGTWVQLFSAACVFNGRIDATGASFTDTWNGELTAYIHLFQAFSALGTTDVADYPTWAQLLVSTGDPDRAVEACDTRFTITAARSRAMYAAGYRFVGRYLDKAVAGGYEKELQPGELADIFAGGLRVFPISQYSARVVTDFTYGLGQEHAARAHDRAAGYGFNQGTVIYFAVDFDATDPQITSNIVPYFHGVQYALAQRGRRYVAGVYGSRNVCTRVSSEAYARYSFVSGMSYGFSGNLGFPMPSNWSFNQIKEFVFTAGGDSFDLDNDAHRAIGDRGAGPENVGSTPSALTAFYTYLDELHVAALAYGNVEQNRLVMDYLRYPQYGITQSGFQFLLPDVDLEWVGWVDTGGPARVLQFTDPSYGVTLNIDHLAATSEVEFWAGGGTGTTITAGDFAGWGGDLCSFYGEWRAAIEAYPSGYNFCTARLAKLNVSSSFQFGDLIEDADGWFLGARVRDNGVRFADATRAYYGNGGHLQRFQRFFSVRFGGTVPAAMETARTMLTGAFPDPVLDGLRIAAIKQTAGPFSFVPEGLTRDELDPFLRGFAETLQRLANP